MTDTPLLDKLPLILIPRSLPSDELLRFIYLIIDNRFPFAKLVVEHQYDYPELIISQEEKYVQMVVIEGYIKETCSHPPRRVPPLAREPQSQ